MDVLPVMYHFVMDQTHILPALKTITVKGFQEQLDYLCEHYKPLVLENIHGSFYSSNGEDSGKFFLLTFDHGTRDHLEIVLPELVKRNLTGYFYIMTCIPEEKKIPVIDKQRYVESHFSTYTDFYQQFYRQCLEIEPGLQEEIEPNSNNLSAARKYLTRFTFYSDHERLFRKVRDFHLPPQLFEELFCEMFKKIFGEEDRFVKSNYLSWEDIQTLQDQGMVIGTHGHEHIFYTSKNVNESCSDVEKSIGLLRERLQNEKINSITYPNGKYCEDLFSCLTANSIDWGFGTHKDLTFNHSRKLNLGRVDTKQCLSEIQHT